MTPDQAVPHVTQRVPLADMADLLSGPARAAIAFPGPDGPECVPVVIRRDGGIRIGLDPDALPAEGPPDRGTLVVDDGAYWFQLRAVVWRGSLTPEGGAGEGGLAWFRFDPRRAVAWDYGRLHEEPA